jgi:hypothetical protein
MKNGLMPSKGYATIGLKPSVISKLQKSTDEYYPGMFLPSALIIMMNEIKREYYSVEMHDFKLDLSGVYTSLTIRLDVKTWLKENYEIHKDEYAVKYKSRNFTQFAGIFMINMFESKKDTHRYLIKLKEADFLWLEEEYEKRKEEYKRKFGVYGFDKFADLFIKEIFEKINTAKKILTI